MLFDEDYEKLRARGITFEQNAESRFFIFTNYVLPEIYIEPRCNVLTIIPPNYNQAGNDMFWTFPRLHRRDNLQIPQTMDPGGGDNRIWQGNEYCRWSRHWNPDSPGVWCPGRDDIVSIYRRVDGALRNPGAQ